MASHIVDKIAWYTVGAGHLRMSIHMSFASQVAHTIGRQLSGSAQSPFLYKGCTRFAHSGGIGVFPMATSHKRATKCLLRLSGSTMIHFGH